MVRRTSRRRSLISSSNKPMSHRHLSEMGGQGNSTIDSMRYGVVLRCVRARMILLGLNIPLTEASTVCVARRRSYDKKTFFLRLKNERKKMGTTGKRTGGETDVVWNRFLLSPDADGRGFHSRVLFGRSARICARSILLLRGRCGRIER